MDVDLYENMYKSYFNFVQSYQSKIGKTFLPKGFLHALVFEPASLSEFDLDSTSIKLVQFNEDAVKSFSTDPDDTLNRIFDDLDSKFETSNKIGRGIKSKSLVSWDVLEELNKNSYYWEGLEAYWTGATPLGPDVIRAVDADTTRILGWCGDPKKPGEWNHHGLVMGHVQSGKTTNYSALIAKALDTGYRHIIILAGITNSLRRQTQERIDEVILGFSSANNETTSATKIGVALYRRPGRSPLSMTTESSDFNAKVKQSIVTHEDPDRELIWVIKKNVKVLEALTQWLTEKLGAGEKLKNPLLVIDDEADNASIDTSIAGNTPSAINHGIRTLLRTSERYSYVGYTATPFANIFIDSEKEGDELISDELFPSDFIYSLDAPSNYVGPHKIFNPEHELFEKCVFNLNEIEEHPIYSDHLKHVDSIPPRHKSGLQIEELPQSLIDSVYLFIMFVAWRIKNKRGDKHASMLINVSLFNAVQEQIYRHVINVLKSAKQAIIAKALHPQWNTNVILNRMHTAFAFYKYDQDGNCTFEDLLPYLETAIARIETVVVNMKGEELRYGEVQHDKGKFVLAIGGLALSRGLTLEGLAVSYIIRNVGAKDTLLQTARWFGYRPGYESMCRVIMPELLEGRFIETAETVDELRADLDRMIALEKTPKEFGLRVRHSGFGLAVTASTKLGASKKMKLAGDYSRRHYQGAEVWNSKTRNEANLALAHDFLNEVVSTKASQQISIGDKDKSNFLLRLNDIDSVIRLLNRWESPQVDFALVSDSKNNLLTDYINSRRTELSEWDIFIPFSYSARDTKGAPDPISAHKTLASNDWFSMMSAKGQFEPTTVLRQRNNAVYVSERDDSGKRDTSRLLLTAKRQLSSNIMSDLTVGMTTEQLGELKDLEHCKKQGDETIKLSDEIFNRLERPLLMIHFLQIKMPNDEPRHQSDLDEDSPVVSISVAFPSTSMGIQEKEYLVNDVFLKQYEEMQQYETSDEAIDD